MAYDLEGRLLEVCNCNAICPCWVGLDPDNGTCEGVLVWHIDKGSIDGTDVSGHTFAVVADIPGNVLKGNWRVVAYVDDGVSDEQQEKILNVWTGKLGGPVADLAGLIGEVVGVEKVPVTFGISEGKGVFKLGDAAEAEMAPLEGATGVTTLADSAFSSIPGSPAYVGTATYYKANVPALGISLDLKDHNSVQGNFHFVS